MRAVLMAISFALCFALMFLGIIMTIHLDPAWLGLLVTLTAGLKFWHYLPQFNEEV